MSVFLKMTQRIESFFFKMWLKELNLFSTCDSKNWTSFWKWFKELNFCLNYTTQSQRIEPSFFITTQRIEHLFFCMWIMFSYDLKNWFIFRKISQRIDSSYDSKNGTWRKDLKFMFLKFDSKVWTLFWITRRLEVFFQNSDAKIFFEKNNSKNWTFYWVWFKELNLFLSMIQRMESLVEYDSKKKGMIQRIELFFEYDSKNETIFFEYDSMNWTFFNMTRNFFL